jgi:hypothetical protein
MFLLALIRRISKLLSREFLNLSETLTDTERRTAFFGEKRFPFGCGLGNLADAKSQYGSLFSFNIIQFAGDEVVVAMVLRYSFDPPTHIKLKFPPTI